MNTGYSRLRLFSVCPCGKCNFSKPTRSLVDTSLLFGVQELFDHLGKKWLSSDILLGRICNISLCDEEAALALDHCRGYAIDVHFGGLLSRALQVAVRIPVFRCIDVYTDYLHLSTSDCERRSVVDHRPGRYIPVF